MKKFLSGFGRSLFVAALWTVTLTTGGGCAPDTSTPHMESITATLTAAGKSSMLAAQNARIREVGEAMPGGGWNVYGNGFLGDWFQVPRAGKITVVVRAAGDPSANIFPLARLWINEKRLQTFSVDSTTYKEYSFEANVPAGTTRVEIEFTNDTNGETPDRNLRVLDISVSPATLAATVPKIGEAGIARYRMGDLIIRGKPGTKVIVTQLRHEFPFGTCLNDAFFEPRPADAYWSEDDRKKYLEIARTWFNAATHENALKWYHTETKQGEVSYEDADRVLQWCEENSLQMRGHTLFWAVDQYVQDWVKALDNQTLEAKVKGRAQEVVTRYAGRINEFDVNNEMLHGDFYGQRLGAQINAEMFKWAKAANPNAVLYVNDYAVLSGPNADRYFNQIKALQAAGAPVGGVGFQGHFGYGLDLRHVRRTLDKFAALKLPLKITEFDLKTGDAQLKARQMTDFYRTCFAHPAIEGISMWGFWQGSHWVPEAAMFGLDWTPKLEAKAYHDLIYNEWWTKVETVVPANGVLHVRAFYGRHQIESKKKKIVIDLKKKDGVTKVQIG